jgi:hypothetical protein
MQALADRLSMTLLCLEVLLENVRYVGEEGLVAREMSGIGEVSGSIFSDCFCFVFSYLEQSCREREGLILRNSRAAFTLFKAACVQ